MAISTAEQGRIEAAASEQSRHAAAWVWQVTLLSLLLGILLAVALQTQSGLRKLGVPTSRFGARAGLAVSLKETNDQLKKSNDHLQEEVQTLRNRTKEIDTQIAQGSLKSSELTKQLQDLDMRAGLVPVQAPGVIITLRDSPKPVPEELKENAIIHDNDINMILGELKASGAEVIGIAGADTSMIQRVIYRTTARCAGPGMVVNDTRLGAPFHVYAIGNPKELRSMLEMPHGVIKQLRLDILDMAKVEESPHIVIPEYTGSFPLSYAKPVTDKPR